MAQGTAAILLSIHGKRLGIGQNTVGGVDGSAALILDGNIIASPNPTDIEVHGSIMLAQSSASTTRGGQLYNSTSSAITALAGGALSASTPVLNDKYNTIAVCATTSDSVALPQATAANLGCEIHVGNEGAATAAVYPANGSSDIINILTSGVGLPLASSKTATFYCTAVGKWRSVAGATS